MANVHWNDLGAYTWDLRVLDKKLRYKTESVKFICTGMPSNDCGLNVLVRILEAGQICCSKFLKLGNNVLQKMKQKC